MDSDVEARRLAIEAIASLVDLKHTMAEMILRPAGVPTEVYGPLMYKRDASTGTVLSKRKIAPLILDALKARNDCQSVLRSIIEIAANWDRFHLAKDEYAARATVQKARELLGTIEVMEARETKQRELARKEELERMEKGQAEVTRKQMELLLMMFDGMAVSDDPQKRGYLLQDLLNRVFDLHQIPVVRPFTRNEGYEQIDGALKIEGWHYLVECRWRQKLADIREVDGLKGQVDRSGKQTMGLFLSINGWSDGVPRLLKQNTEKSIILMEGYDLRTILTGQADPQDFILAKAERLNLDGEPFFGAGDYLSSRDAKRHER